MQDTVIRLQNLSKKFGHHSALKEVNLSVRRGEVCGIIGMSGAGKSTLMRCLTGLEKPSSGEIFLNEIPLSGLDPLSLRGARKKMGMIFQHFNLFSARTVCENIAYPLEIDGIQKNERFKQAHALVEMVGLNGKEGHYPSQLSGGEKQRVAIARALSRYPDVLLCDEATSALDPRTTQSILELLSRLNQTLGLTLLLITHEMEVIKQICTHVAVLEGGQIVEEGRTAALFSAPKHPTTKRFLQNIPHILPTHLLPLGENQEILRLSFVGNSATQPLISQLIRGFNVEVNILLGGIDALQEGTVGNLVVALSGSAIERANARKFLSDHGVLCDFF